MWKNLPSLAMPDGSHNFVEDTVYFHLPSITQPGKTVYGVSSYRQIEAKVRLGCKNPNLFNFITAFLFA